MKSTFLDFYDRKLILASKSPRRQDIFNMVGLDFNVHPSNYQENKQPHKSPAELALYHSRAKCQDVANDYQDAWIIGADTIVVINNEILEKPHNAADAKNMLHKLSGATHEVITGYTILNSENGKKLSAFESTRVTFHELAPELIKHYIDNYKYEDKAGSYAIQDFSALFVKGIDGCFYNVVGFPIAAFCQLVKNKLSTCL